MRIVGHIFLDSSCTRTPVQRPFDYIIPLCKQNNYLLQTAILFYGPERKFATIQYVYVYIHTRIIPVRFTRRLGRHTMRARHQAQCIPIYTHTNSYSVRVFTHCCAISYARLARGRTHRVMYAHDVYPRAITDRRSKPRLNYELINGTRGTITKTPAVTRPRDRYVRYVVTGTRESRGRRDVRPPKRGVRSPSGGQRKSAADCGRLENARVAAGRGCPLRDASARQVCRRFVVYFYYMF